MSKTDDYAIKPKRVIEEEIENCILVVQDIETDRYVRIEFQNKLIILRKALNKI